MTAPELPLAVLGLGCVLGMAAAAAGHMPLALAGCVAALGALWLLLDAGGAG